MIRVLIADDHTIVREGLKQILADNPSIEVTGEASSGIEVIKKINEKYFDVVVLDISMPGQNGLDTLKQIKYMKPATSVLILSMHPEEQYAIRSIKAGASGYLTKDSASEELITAIQKISEGRRYITSSLAEKLASALTADTKKMPHENLSDREYQVLCLIASGYTVTQISKRLSLSIKTVSTYRSRLLTKMNMENNSQITHYAIKYNLVE